MYPQLIKKRGLGPIGIILPSDDYHPPGSGPTRPLKGIAHLVPTRNVVAGFGEISEDNRNIIAMEWIVEGVSLIFIGALVAVVTYISPFGEVPRAAYAVAVAALLALAVVSLFMGFKVRLLPFKLCPFVLTISAALIFVGGLL